MPTLEELRPEYEQLFNTCIINSRNFAAIDGIAVSITGSKTTYEAVGKPLNIPWYFIGIIHAMECNLDFKNTCIMEIRLQPEQYMVPEVCQRMVIRHSVLRKALQTLCCMKDLIK